MMRKIIIIVVLVMLGAACSRDDDVASTGATLQGEPGVTPPSDELARKFSLEAMSRGAAVFQANCAQCHGPQAQGHPGWEEGVNSEFAMAPPLDGTSSLWQRNKQDIINTIKQGIKRGNTPVMPGWKGRLSEQEIEDTIAWFQALWPPEVYDRWQRANATSDSRSSGS